jgi:hypothetical protein
MGKVTINGCRGCPAIATVLGTPLSRFSCSFVSIKGGKFDISGIWVTTLPQLFKVNIS